MTEFRARLRLKERMFYNMTVKEAFQHGPVIRLWFEEIPWIGQVNRAHALDRMKKNLGWKTPGDLFPKGERFDVKVYHVRHPSEPDMILVGCDVIPGRRKDD